MTGGSGFVASHVLAVLLQRGHSVVVTVRSTEKGQWIAKAHPSYDKSKLDFVVVEDIRTPGGKFSGLILQVTCYVNQ